MSAQGIKTMSGSFVSRTAGSYSTSAKFKQIETVTADTDFYATGSFAGSKGFIVQTAGNSVITPIQGDSIAASAVTAKTLYEIGVNRVSGSGLISLRY